MEIVYYTPSEDEIKEGFRFEFSYETEGVLVSLGKPVPLKEKWTTYTEWCKSEIFDFPKAPGMPTIEHQICRCKRFLLKGHLRTSKSFYEKDIFNG